MKIFSHLEKGLSKAVEITGTVVSKIDEATEGWGERADQFLETNGFKDIKDKVAPVAAAVKEKAEIFADKAEETVNRVVNDVKASNSNTSNPQDDETEDDFIAEEDAVQPERTDAVNAEDIIVPVPVTSSVADANVAPVVEKKNKPAKKTASKKTNNKKTPTLSELKEEAKNLNVKGYSKMNKEELTKAVKKAKKNS